MSGTIIVGLMIAAAVLLTCTKSGRRILLIVIDRLDKIHQNLEAKREKRLQEGLQGHKSDEADEQDQPREKKALKFKRKEKPEVVISPVHEYWRRKRFFYDIQGRHEHKGQILKSDWDVSTITHGDRQIGVVDRRDVWTDEPMEELQKRGYTVADHLYDTMAMSGVRVVMRVTGGYVFDVHQRDEHGIRLYSEDTAATLHDVMTSTATAEFLKGMSKATSPQISKQQILFIAIIGAGAIFGLYMLGFFR